MVAIYDRRNMGNILPTRSIVYRAGTGWQEPPQDQGLQEGQGPAFRAVLLDRRYAMTARYQPHLRV